MFNTHTDVVPVDLNFWTMGDPFEARIVDGEIVARGSTDMKCVGAAQLAAIVQLKASGWDNPTPRDLHFAFTPEEEIGGQQGWGLFIDAPEFEALNVGFYMDEGLAHEDSTGIEVYYSERVGASCRITARGNAGHGSQFIPDTAAAKLVAFSAEILTIRDEQEKMLNEGKHADGTPFALGDVTTINLTIMNGGKQTNVVPNELECTFDIRVTPHMDHNAFVGRIKALADKHGVEMTTLRVPVIPGLTPVEDPLYARWWEVVKGAAEKRGLEARKRVFPAASDARYLRRKGIPALGCSVGWLCFSTSLVVDFNCYFFSTSSGRRFCSTITMRGCRSRFSKRESIGMSTWSKAWLWWTESRNR
jgi:aminoacylase